MNFQDLLTIESSQQYLDIAFNSATKKAEAAREKKIADKLKKSKYIELEKIKAVHKAITRHFNKILVSYPSLNQLPEFYRELIRLTTDYGLIRKSLGAVKWVRDVVDKLYSQYSLKIQKAEAAKDINRLRKEFFGRVSSVVKQISESLSYLETTRKILKSYPNIKTSVKSVAIAGYPNVGKSSLLKALTTAKPEVNSYPFTTKRINIGYYLRDNAKENKTAAQKKELTDKEAESLSEKAGSKEISTRKKEKIQLIDVPGTFKRDKKNTIELLAELVLKHVSEKIVFVIDPTESCGYSLDSQLKLAKKIMAYKQPMLFAINKCDLLEESLGKSGFERKKQELSKRLGQIAYRPKLAFIAATTGKGLNKIISFF